MSQIRRQPKRKSKKGTLQTMNNPFQSCLSYLPPSMAKKIAKLDKVIWTNLDELLTQPEIDPHQNLSLIKEALKRQQVITNEIKDGRERSSKKSQSQTQEPLVEEKDLEYGYELEMQHNELMEYPLELGIWGIRQESSLNFFGLQ